MASISNSLYITFIEVVGDLLKIYGQKDRVAGTFIEKQLSRLSPHFDKFQCPNPTRIRKGICFAKDEENKLCRVRVISSVQEDRVRVLFVDDGKKGLINVSNIRVPEGLNSDVLMTMAEQVEEYYLANVIAPVGGWTDDIMKVIRKDFEKKEFPFEIVDQVGDQRIINIKFHNGVYSEFLIQNQIARSINLPAQKQLILSYCSLVTKESNQNMPDLKYTKPSSGVPNQSGVKLSSQPVNMMNDHHELYNYGKQNNPVNYSQLPPPVAAHYSVPKNINSIAHNSHKIVPPKTFYSSTNIPNNHLLRNENHMHSMNPPFNPAPSNQYNPAYQMKVNQEIPLLNEVVIEALAHHVKLYMTEDNAKSEAQVEKIPHNYVSSVLEVGSTHNVFISHIDDGPWSFSVQLLSSESELNKLMEDLASTDLIPVKPPLILGHPCIGISAVYGNLCRGVIVSISHSAVKVYFVDFGNTEDLPVTSLFELPPKFFKTRVLSQKFSLSGLQKVSYSNEIKRLFKEVVHDELLMLRVTSLEGDNLPNCELYHKDRNIKRLLNDKIRELKTSQDDLPKVGETVDVVVTWVESPDNFFLQLRGKDAELNALKRELANTPRNCQPLQFKELSVGLKCICQYSSDEQWYRVVIASIKSENAITVFYIDYGNMETVNISLLRKSDSYGLVAQMGVQAIQCSLKGFEGRSFDQDVTNNLESLILEKDLKMKIVSSDKGRLIVELYENGKDITSMLLARYQKSNSNVDMCRNKENVSGWRDSGENKQQSVSKTDQKLRYPGGSDLFERRENKSFRGDRDRPNFSREKNFNSRQGPELKSDRFHITQNQSRKRFEDRGFKREDNPRGGERGVFRQDKENNWNDKKTFGGNNTADKPGWNRGGRQMDGWTDSKGNDKLSVRPASRFDDSSDWRDRPGKSKFDESKGRRRKFDDNKTDGKTSNRSFGFQGSRSSDFGGNKKFSDDGNFSVNDKKLDEAKSARQTIPKEELAAPGSQYEERCLEVGSCEKALVTFYLSPDEFFLQLSCQEKEFKKMMDDIQCYYHDKLPSRNFVEKNEIVIAQFSGDDVLYRAEVIRSSPLTVRYVDYGNQEEVGSKSTWPVVKKFLDIPKQAVKCRLSNLKPVGSEWPPPSAKLGKFFESDAFKCKFLKFQEGVYEVSMENLETGKDLATEIIAASLGLPETPRICIDEVDFSLLPSQFLKLYVTHVESSSKFYVILNPKSVKVIEHEIKEYTDNKKNLKPLDKSYLQPGTKCLSTNDDVLWHRGTIIEIIDNRIVLRFDDRGDSVNVTSDKIMAVPKYLADFQPQAFECCLDAIPENISASEEEEFKNSVEQKYQLIYIKSVIDERLSVVLYDLEGQKSTLQNSNDSPQTVEPLTELPILSQGIPVVMSFIESPEELYVQRAADWNDIEILSQHLSEFYEENNEEDDIEKDGSQGELVAAKSVEHGSWYRARVVSSSEETIEVFYIDFGNKEKIPRENVKKLDPSFRNLNVFARKVSFPVNYEPELKTELNNKISELIGEKVRLVYFWNDSGKFFTEFVVEGKMLQNLWKSMDRVVPINNAEVFYNNLPKVKSAETLPTVATDSHSSYRNVFVIHIDSPKQFWVHQEGSINDLNSLQEKLQNQCQNSPDKERSQPGEIVAVYYCGTWYRAEIVKAEENILTVKFIDYGNVLDLDTKGNPVKELTPDLRNVPIFATRYSLKGNWDDSFTSKFEGIIMQFEDPVNAVILEDGDPKVVDLFKDGQSIVEKLMEESGDQEQGEAQGEEGDVSTVYITYSNSPADFYIQRESCTEVLENLTSRLSKPECLEDVSFVQENETYVAKFAEDETWYRAKVIKKCSEGTEVLFIDFGNTSNVTELKRLPEDLSDIPPLSENCCLLNGNNSDEWSDAACEKFVEYCDGRPLIMKVIVNRMKKPIVQLFFEDCNITDELDAFCEGDGREDVYVSHVNSPTDFYIQYVNDEHFKKITDALVRDDWEDVEDKKPGALCQACFADDGLWYRAKILQNLDEGYEVFFIDYGNVSMSTNLRKLPLEVEGIPPRALRCSLDLPETNIPESVKEEFIMLTGNSESVIRAKVVTPGDVNVISLKVNGRILEETLFLDVTPERNHSTYHDLARGSDLHGSLDDETDDDKNSKKIVMSEHYLSSNFDDDVMAGSSVRNETDEEKRVKIAISAVDGGLEGFKSDDEKGISENGVLSSIVNVTDNELIEESQENVEELSVDASESNDGNSGERVEEEEILNEVPVENDVNDENPEELPSTDTTTYSETKTENEDTSETKTDVVIEASGSQSEKNEDDNDNKIVQGSTSQKEEEQNDKESTSSGTKSPNSKNPN